MNGELTKHMIKRPFYSVDYFFYSPIEIYAPVLVQDLEDIFKYASKVVVDTRHDIMENYEVYSVGDFNALVSFLKNKYGPQIDRLYVESVRFRLSDEHMTWFDMSNEIRVVKEELPA